MLANIEEVAHQVNQSKTYVMVTNFKDYHLIVDGSFMYSCNNLTDAVMNLYFVIIMFLSAFLIYLY